MTRDIEPRFLVTVFPTTTGSSTTRDLGPGFLVFIQWHGGQVIRLKPRHAETLLRRGKVVIILPNTRPIQIPSKQSNRTYQVLCLVWKPHARFTWTQAIVERIMSEYPATYTTKSGASKDGRCSCKSRSPQPASDAAWPVLVMQHSFTDTVSPGIWMQV